MASVRLENVEKAYPPDVRALDNVGLAIESGEFFTLLGPSGCGKTTLLRTIAGFIAQDRGRVLIDDEPVDNVPAYRRDTGMVFQDYAIFPHLSVQGNVAFGLRNRQVPRSDFVARVERALDTVRLGGYGDRMPHELSGGQQQRVALGRALVRDPIAFLFDEPLSNLDAKLRAAMRTELIKIHRELGTTIVHVTHDQVEAMTMGERMCIMRDGRVVQVGAPLEVYRHPADTFVAGFLASPPMNLLSARLVAGEGTVEIELSGTRVPVPGDRQGVLEKHFGKPIIFGLRPEDLLTEGTKPSHVPIDAKVVTVEALGPDVVLIASLADGQEIAARLGRGFSAPVGSALRLHADMEMMHVFDADSGRAIS